MAETKREPTLEEAVRQAAAALRRALVARAVSIEAEAEKLEETRAWASWDKDVVSRCQSTAEQLRTYARELRQEAEEAERRMLPKREKIHETTNPDLADVIRLQRAEGGV